MGIHGTPLAAVICTEAQARTSLHGHGLVWGGTPPPILDAITEDPELVQLAALAMESQVVTSLPASEHEAWEAIQVNRERAERMLVHKQALPPYRRMSIWPTTKLNPLPNGLWGRFKSTNATCRVVVNHRGANWLSLRLSPGCWGGE